jgi:hypothetical protein
MRLVKVDHMASSLLRGFISEASCMNTESRKLRQKAHRPRKLPKSWTTRSPCGMDYVSVLQAREQSDSEEQYG